MALQCPMNADREVSEQASAGRRAEAPQMKWEAWVPIAWITGESCQSRSYSLSRSGRIPRRRWRRRCRAGNHFVARAVAGAPVVKSIDDNLNDLRLRRVTLPQGFADA